MDASKLLEQYEIYVEHAVRNAVPALLYEAAVRDDDAGITAEGVLATRSGVKTGRSPKDKRIVDNPASTDDIWWGTVNIKMDEHTFLTNRQRAIDFLNMRPKLYVVDGYAGWDPDYRLKIRVVCARPYHALFMYNMLIRPSLAELENFGNPDYVIFNAGEFPANSYTRQMTSRTSIDLCFESGEFVILGTEYAGEMKKGVFTIMNYLMPKRGVLSMHCSANEDDDSGVSLFFGLSGTGKTTLSADPRRRLIGDDEHCWSDKGTFNIEGGCYAKCVNLASDKEPVIYRSIRFGAVLENIVYDEDSRVVDYSNTSVTENTRASYPIEFVDNAKIPCVAGHPSNVILLTCDAFGVLPPVSRLSPAQTMYHFISGYTAKVAGTEEGVTEPETTFSACFGAAFLVWHPTRYAEMLAQRMRTHGSQGWLINTGWTGGSFPDGSRIRLAYTRAIIDAIHSGELVKIPTRTDPVFGLHVPVTCPEVPAFVLDPRQTWADGDAYDRAAQKLAKAFRDNFAKYASLASPETCAAGPRLPEEVTTL